VARITVNLDDFGFLRCQQCGLPWARLQGSVLIVQSKHYGETHVNTVTVEELAELLYNRKREAIKA